MGQITHVIFEHKSRGGGEFFAIFGSVVANFEAGGGFAVAALLTCAF